MKSEKPKGTESLLSMDPDKADKTGFLHGVRAKIAKFRAVLYNYPNKDGVPATNDDGSEVQAPGYMVDFEVKGGTPVTNQFYANGSFDQRRPNKSGTGFVRSPDSKVTSALNEGSNAFLLISSLKGCGWPSAQLAGDCSVFEGAVVDLIAQPVGQTKRAKAEGERTRTIAVVGKIVSYPEGVVEGAEDDDEPEADDEPEVPVKKAKKPAPPAPDDDEPDDDDEPEEAEESDDEPDEGDDPLTTEAREFVATVLDQKKYRGKPINLSTLSREVLLMARAHKSRQKIVALVQDPAFHKDAAEFWTYDKKTKTIQMESE